MGVTDGLVGVTVMRLSGCGCDRWISGCDSYETQWV